MRLTIELDDPRFCNGCPALGEFDCEPGWCEMNHWKSRPDVNVYYNTQTEEIRRGLPDGFSPSGPFGVSSLMDGFLLGRAGWQPKMLRPDTCVTKNGA